MGAMSSLELLLRPVGWVRSPLTALADAPRQGDEGAPNAWVEFEDWVVDALQGDARDLAKLGLAGTMRRVGFQAHDGRIFEALAGRGGILVAIRSEPRAADALALLHSYGGGNAAIGAWTGRV